MSKKYVKMGGVVRVDSTPSAICKCNTTQTPIHCLEANDLNCSMTRSCQLLLFSSADGVMAILAAAMVDWHFC
jgi:hypothetical protein